MAVQGYCPSCEECDNQIFTKRQYAQIEQVRGVVLCMCVPMSPPSAALPPTDSQWSEPL